MDMKQLTTFIVLAKTLNYQKAAEQLNYAPSTLYSHIQALEQELNAAMFIKTGRQMQLTREGTTFLAYAERILTEYHESLAALEPESTVEGNVSVGGCEVNTGYNIIKLLTTYAESNPLVRLNMTSASNASIPALVKSDALEVGFYFSLQEQDFPGLKSTYLYQEPILLVAAKDHPLAAMEHLQYEDLEGLDFAFPHDDCLFVLEMLNRLKKRRITIGKTSYLGGVQLVIRQVLKNKALALVPLSAALTLQESNDIVTLQMDEEPLWVWETLLYKNFDTLKPAAKNLLRYCVNYAQRRLNTSLSSELRAPLRVQH